MEMNYISRLDMVSRDTITLKMSQLLEYEDAPEKVCILLPESIIKGAFDIGIIAYSLRGMSSKPNNTVPQPVCSFSLKKERQTFLTLLFDHLLIKAWRDSSILAFVKSVRAIVNWADSNNYADLFEAPEKFRAAYFEYTSYLNGQIFQKKLKPITASQSQKSMRDMAEINFGEDMCRQIISGITTISHRTPELDAPEKALVKHNIDIFLAIAKGYGRAVLEMQPYPWLLQMPGYHTYVFPAGSGIKTPFTTKHITTFNYVKGVLSTIEEMKSINNRTKNNNVQDLKKAQRNIDKHNSLGLNSYYRKFDVSMALTAYMQLFMLTTGCYGNEARQIVFDNTLNVERNVLHHSFRAVKFRASGKIVNYNLGSKFGLIILKEYLKFRNFILQGKECSFLFFRMNRDGKPVQHTEASIASLVTRERKFFFSSDVQIVRSRQARKFKSVTLHEAKTGTEITAKILNHKEKTNEKSYTPSSPDTSKKELGKLWLAISKSAKEIKISQNASELDLSIPTGHCSNKGSPEKIQDSTPIEPDCKKQFGCLFCSKYLIHADHDDIRKLLSVRYVIEQVLRMSTDSEKSEKLLRELCVRIDYLIERLKCISNAIKILVNKLYVDVFEYGDLTAFWSFRLERYAEMGMIL
ncbi:TPA: hypothetical protein RUX41_002224 [Aeromonas dhakensis]|nr:hypothetical protein [Aeromonas dhakensis]